jgi:hypothetical protein
MTSLLLALLLTQAADKQAEEAAVAAVTVCEQVFSKNQDSNPRIEAMNTMAQTQHEKVLAKLLIYLSDKDKAVKLAAVQATLGFQSATPELKRLANKNLLRSLESGINVKDVDFRVSVTNALAAMNDESSVTTIKTLLDDKSLRVSMAAINASVAMRQKPLLEEMMRQQRECEKTMKASNNVQFKGRKPTSAKKDENAPPDPEDVKNERAATLVTLIPPAVKELTGQDLKTGAEMDVWWTKNRSSFTIPPK